MLSLSRNKTTQYRQASTLRKENTGTREVVGEHGSKQEKDCFKQGVIPEIVFDLHVCKMAHTCPHLCTFTYKHKHKYLKHTQRYHEDVSFGDYYSHLSSGR